MEKLRRLLSRIRLVYRRSSLLLKGLVIAMILTFTVAMIALQSSIVTAERQAEELRKEAAVLEVENRQLLTDISILGTVESAKKLAYEKLGLMDPNAVILDPVQE